MRRRPLPLWSFSFATFALGLLAACHPPADPHPEAPSGKIAAARPPAKAARAPASTAVAAPAGDAAPAGAAAENASPGAAPDGTSAAPAVAPPACPTGYTCDLDAWDRAPRPAVNEIFVQKGPHRLHLVAGNTIVRTYSVALGWGGMGPKKYEGDGVTPTGVYAITDHLDSKWHTFLGVSYPNVQDQHEFPYRRARGEVPAGRGIGFGIAIHGHAKTMADGEHKKSDWTLGCIALDNGEIDEVAAAVKRGTKIVIVD